VLTSTLGTLALLRMAGHSKWKQIKHYKAAADAKRGAMFTKLIREITVAAKFGGGDPAGNPRLRTAIDAAKAASMPKENIERAIKKGTGELEGVEYSEVLYEAYGPGGVALMVQALTDNPNRTVAEVRHKLSRGGGNLGATNSVAWMFDRKGRIYLDAAHADEDAAMEAALEAGAEDFVREDDQFLVTTESSALHTVKEALEVKGFAATDAAIEWIPKNTVRVEGKDAESLVKLLEALEDLDDVQKVEGNFDIPEDAMAGA
jgi:YebC/PmpR family DNA-binding regulatory protein